MNPRKIISQLKKAIPDAHELKLKPEAYHRFKQECRSRYECVEDDEEPLESVWIGGVLVTPADDGQDLEDEPDHLPGELPADHPPKHREDCCS